MVTIFQGEDVAAAGRTTTITIPTVAVPDGYTVSFRFNGTEKRAPFRSKEILSLDYTRDETEKFSLGISHGSLWIEDNNGMRFCASSSIPVLVTDCAERANAVNSTISLVSTLLNASCPIDVKRLEQAATLTEVKEALNAVVDAINYGEKVDKASSVSYIKKTLNAIVEELNAERK